MDPFHLLEQRSGGDTILRFTMQQAVATAWRYHHFSAAAAFSYCVCIASVSGLPSITDGAVLTVGVGNVEDELPCLRDVTVSYVQYECFAASLDV